MKQKLLKTLSEAGFSELLIAMGFVFILGIISTAMSVMTTVQIKQQVLKLNKQEAFYTGELAAWHFYYKNNGASKPCSDHAGPGGRCIISIINETIRDETKQNEYHPDSYQPGVPLTLSTTRLFDSHNTILRRYTGDNVTIKTLPRTDSVSFCGEMSFSVRAKTFSTCLVRPTKEPSSNFKLEHIGFKEIPFRVHRLFNVRHFAVQNDGKIVIVGSEWDTDPEDTTSPESADGLVWRLMRLMPDGSIDRSFGDWGYAESYGNRHGMAARKVEISQDGKIVVAGVANVVAPSHSLVVARYLSSGEIDLSFGEAGFAWPPTPSVSHIYTPVLALSSEGGVLVGASELTGAEISVCLARLHSNGSVDKSFGTNGLAKYRFTKDGHDYAQSIAWASDGKILVAGHSDNRGYYWVARLLSDGTLDSSFGIAGKAVLDLSNTCKWGSLAPAMTIHKDSIIVGGSCAREKKNLIGTDPILLKWTKEGTPDASFGGVGYVILDLDYSAVDQTKTLIKGIIGLDNGSLLAVGRGGPKYQHVTFWKILSNGTLDSTFGKNGELYHKNILFHKKDMPLGGSGIADDTHFPVPVSSIRELSGGKILLAGGVYYSAHFYVSRHNLNGEIDTFFATNGIFKGSLPYTDAQASSVVIQNDGMTVVGGFANAALSPYQDMPLLARITPKLEFDSTFGGKIQDVCAPRDYQSADGLPGRVNACPSPPKSIRAFWDYALDHNGKILGTGAFLKGDTSFSHISLGRYNTDGSVDKNFGEGGVNAPHTFASYAGAGIGGAKAVLPLPDGSIMVVSTGWTGSNDPRVISILRFNSSGSLDNSFGNKGVVTTDFNTVLPDGYAAENLQVTAASLQSDGKIVVIGYITLAPTIPDFKNMPNTDVLIARFLATEVLDTTFGKQGYERVDFKDLTPKSKKIPGLPVGTPDGSYDYGHALLIESGGKILVGGCSASMGTYGGFSTISRLDSQGVLDPSFGKGGRILEDIDLGPEKNDFTDRDCIKGLIALPGGRFMAAISFGTKGTEFQGQYDATKTQNNIFYIVYGSDGTREKSFGENGILRFLPGDFVTVIEDIATRGDLISAAGTAIHSPWDYNFIVDMWRIVRE